MNNIQLWIFMLTLGSYTPSGTGQVMMSATQYHTNNRACTGQNDIMPLTCDSSSVIELKELTYGGNFKNPNCDMCGQKAQCKKARMGTLTHKKALTLYKACSGRSSCANFKGLFAGDNVWTLYAIQYQCLRERDMVDICSSDTYHLENSANIVYKRTVNANQNCACVVRYQKPVSIIATDVRLLDDATQCRGTSLRLKHGDHEWRVNCSQASSEPEQAFLRRSIPDPAMAAEADLLVALDNISFSSPPQMVWLTVKAAGNLTVVCNKKSTGDIEKHTGGSDESPTPSLGKAIGIPVAVLLVISVVCVLTFIAYRRGMLPFCSGKPDGRHLDYYMDSPRSGTAGSNITMSTMTGTSIAAVPVRNTENGSDMMLDQSGAGSTCDKDSNASADSSDMERSAPEPQLHENRRSWSDPDIRSRVNDDIYNRLNLTGNLPVVQDPTYGRLGDSQDTPDADDTYSRTARQAGNHPPLKRVDDVYAHVTKIKCASGSPDVASDSIYSQTNAETVSRRPAENTYDHVWKAKTLNENNNSVSMDSSSSEQRHTGTNNNGVRKGSDASTNDGDNYNKLWEASIASNSDRSQDGVYYSDVDTTIEAYC